MKTIVICGSRRFATGIRKLAKTLKQSNIIVFEPFLNKKPVDLENDFRKYIFTGLTLHHFELIRKADIVLIYNKDGYMGVSSTLELGFAVSQSKIIYAISEDIEEPCRNVLFDKILSYPEDILKVLKENEKQ